MIKKVGKGPSLQKRTHNRVWLKEVEDAISIRQLLSIGRKKVEQYLARMITEEVGSHGKRAPQDMCNGVRCGP